MKAKQSLLVIAMGFSILTLESCKHDTSSSASSANIQTASEAETELTEKQKEYFDSRVEELNRFGCNLDEQNILTCETPSTSFQAYYQLQNIKQLALDSFTLRLPIESVISQKNKVMQIRTDLFAHEQAELSEAIELLKNKSTLSVSMNRNELTPSIEIDFKKFQEGLKNILKLPFEHKEKSFSDKSKTILVMDDYLLNLKANKITNVIISTETKCTDIKGLIYIGYNDTLDGIKDFMKNLRPSDSCSNTSDIAYVDAYNTLSDQKGAL
jgi:hypothetical protein